MNTFKLWVWDADLALLWRMGVRTVLECRTARALSNGSSLDENVQCFAGSQAKLYCIALMTDMNDLTQKERLEHQAIVSLHRLTSIKIREIFQATLNRPYRFIFVRFIIDLRPSDLTDLPQLPPSDLSPSDLPEAPQTVEVKLITPTCITDSTM